jgi:hypothetical protein
MRCASGDRERTDQKPHERNPPDPVPVPPSDQRIVHLTNGEGQGAYPQRIRCFGATAPPSPPLELARAEPRSSSTSAVLLSGAGYVNYAAPDEPSDRVRAAFGPERFARLAAMKRRLDSG